MEQQKVFVNERQNNSNQNDQMNAILMDLFMSIFFAIGVYAEYDLLLKIQMPVAYLISTILGFFVVFSLSLIFIKAGEAGWKAFIPIYNFITYL